MKHQVLDCVRMDYATFAVTLGYIKCFTIITSGLTVGMKIQYAIVRVSLRD